jgi:hypothetical protein
MAFPSDKIDFDLSDTATVEERDSTQHSRISSDFRPTDFD